MSDTHGLLNIAFSFWNEKDDFLKERLFGLSNPQGNHGESIKDTAFHLDNTPTHSYMKYLYKYPQRRFPYEQLVPENAKRGKTEKEYQLLDMDIVDDDRYFDCFIEIAKETEDELLFLVTAYNRGPEAAPLHIIPHVWFRNSWSWNTEKDSRKPSIRQIAPFTAQTKHEKLGNQFVQLSPSPGIGTSGQDIQPRMLFTENDTNLHALYGSKNPPRILSLM